MEATSCGVQTAVEDCLKERQAPPLVEATPVEKRKSTSEPEEGRSPKIPKSAAAAPNETAFELSHNRSYWFCAADALSPTASLTLVPSHSPRDMTACDQEGVCTRIQLKAAH